MLPKFEDLVFYEIYPNSFKDSDGDGFGDLKGIISKLDYVHSLGFNAIWLNPIYDSPFKDGGYDVTDPFKVSPRYGTNEDLKELVRLMHEKGMRLFLDLIPGHMSTQNKNFLNSAKAYANEDSDLFIWNDNVWELDPKYRLISGVYDRNGCYMVNFFAHQPAINYGFNEVLNPKWQKSYKEVTAGREYLEKIMAFWLDMGVDGFRVDMADSLVKNDKNKTATIWLWQQIRKDLKEKGYKEFYMTSEWCVPHRSLKAGFDSDFILDHWTNFSHFMFRQNEEGLKPLLVKYDAKLFERFVTDVKKKIRTARKFHGQISPISGNHDTWRIANYLKGDELKLAYLFLLTLPGVPYIYYGDELEFHTDTSMPSFEGGYQRTGSRLPMRFDSSKNAGFSTADKTFLPMLQSDLTVEEAEKDPESLLNLIKKLIAIRKENPDLRDTSKFDFDEGIFSYVRGNIKVCINLLDTEQVFNASSSQVICKVGSYRCEDDKVILAPKSGVILKA